MTSQETLNVLKKQPNKWFTPKEISVITGVKPGNITKHLNIMFRVGFVLKKQKKENCWIKTYWRYKD